MWGKAKLAESLPSKCREAAPAALRKSSGLKFDSIFPRPVKTINLNNLPLPNQPIGVIGHEDYIEECKEMPAAFAYWAVLEKRWQIIPNPFDLNGKWAWAQVGVAELAMKQGDGLAFVFVTNGDVKFPD